MRRRSGLFALGVAAVLLAACGQGGEAPSGGEGARTPPPGSLVLTQRGANAPRAEAPADANFALQRSYSNVADDGTAEVCLVFSGPLDAGRDYGPFVEVNAGSPVSVAVRGEALCVAGLGFGESREATLLQGLPAADGRALQRDETVPLDLAERPAFVGFSGSGVILPRLEADGLGIETVNVEAVSVRVLRVNDRALVFKSVTEGQSAGEGDYWWLYGEDDPEDVAEEVFKGVLETPGPANAAVTTVFPLARALGALQPGAYVVQISDADAGSRDDTPARAHRWVLFTDVALTAYRGQSGLDLTARSLQSGRALGDVTMRVIARNNEILAEAATGPEGRARIDGPRLAGQGPMAPKLVLAYAPSGDFAMLDLSRAPLDLSEHDVTGRDAPGAVEAYVYLDRGIYRPGETVHAVGMLRDATTRAIADRAGRFVVYRPNGLEAFETRFDGARQAGGVSLAYATPRSAQRGLWRIALEADGIGTVAEETFSVEDFVPQRIAVSLDAGDGPIGAREARTLTVQSDFLYGAPGAGLPVRVQARIEADPNPFPAFAGYVWGRHDDPFAAELIDLPEAVADGSGAASLPLRIGRIGLGASQPLRANIVASVLEPGGRAVRESERAPYRPEPLYLGVKIDEAGQGAHTVRLAAVDAAGEGVARDLDWRLLRVEQRYDWYRDGGGQWRWRSTREVIEDRQGRLATGADGRAEVALSGLDWGDYELHIADAATQRAASAAFWSGWGGRAGEGVQAPDRLRLDVSDAPLAANARETTLAVFAPYAGEAEIALATTGVHAVVGARLQEGRNEITVPVSTDWGGGVYALVSLYSSRDPVQRPRPRRALGVAYLGFDDAPRRLTVSIEAPDIARPETEATVRLAVAGGQGRTYATLAAVDEGILRLTQFASPDAEAAFLSKRALGVEVFDDYGRLLDPNLGAAGTLRSGGDGIGGEGLTVVPTQTVAFFSGIVEVTGGAADIPLDLPAFDGRLRLMAVAWSERAVGSSDAGMIVRAPVTVQTSLPRFLAPGDVAQATVSVGNVEGAPGRYETALSVAGPLRAVDGAQAAFDLAVDQRRDVGLSLAANGAGVGEVRVTAKGPGAFETVRTYAIEARTPFAQTTRVTRERLAAGAAWTVSDEALGFFTPPDRRVEVSYSAFPLDAAALLSSLSRYPYGCTEQIVSAAQPMLVSQRFQPDGGADASRARIQTAVDTLLDRQGFDGAIGLWRRGDNAASPWIMVYSADFLARAKAAGYRVPDEAMDRAMDQLADIAEGQLWRLASYETYRPDFDEDRGAQERLARRSAAYAHYVLARAGRGDIQRLRYLHDRNFEGARDALLKAHVGAGLAAMGDRGRARNAFDAALGDIGRNDLRDYYQSPLRDLAGVVALAGEAGFDDVVQALSPRLATDAPDPARLSTQEKAFALFALDALVPDGEPISRVFTVDPASPAVPAASGPVWATAVYSGAPARDPGARADRLQAEKDIFAEAGGLADLAAVRQGDRFVVRLRLFPEEARLNPLIVEDRLPAGFEIEAVLRPEDSGETGAYRWLGEIDAAKSAEARDDRFVAAIDAWQKPVTLAYVVRAVTPGRFTLPGVAAEDMYRPEIGARTPASTLTVAARE